MENNFWNRIVFQLVAAGFNQVYYIVKKLTRKLEQIIGMKKVETYRNKNENCVSWTNQDTNQSVHMVECTEKASEAFLPKIGKAKVWFRSNFEF